MKQEKRYRKTFSFNGKRYDITARTEDELKAKVNKRKLDLRRQFPFVDLKPKKHSNNISYRKTFTFDKKRYDIRAKSITDLERKVTERIELLREETPCGILVMHNEKYGYLPISYPFRKRFSFNGTRYEVRAKTQDELDDKLVKKIYELQRINPNGDLSIYRKYQQYPISISKTSIYGVWCGMKQRCNNPKSRSYPSYGGRGIMVCNEWLDDPWAFYEWANESGYKKGLAIDRIDNDGDYKPSNCRWVTPNENNHNKYRRPV